MTRSTRILIRNAHLLDPRLPELQDRHDLLVEGDTIRELSDRPLQVCADHVIDAAGRTLMPGLIDLHVHVVAVELDLARQARLPNVLVTLRSVPLLRAMLRRGFTTVRDAGGAGFAFKQALDAGLLQGPRLFVSGRALSPTGGHGDMRPRSDHLEAPLCPHCPRVGALARVADGVDAVRRAAREELQMGADQLKIMASGGVASPTDPVDAWGYGDDEIRAVVDEAEARHTHVMAHAYTAPAIARAVRCGVRTIEHGNLVDAPTALLMARHGAYAVPTLVTYDALATEGAALGLPPESVAKVARVREAGLRSLALYQAAGVKMGFGTDLLGPSQRLQSDEFRLRAEVLSPWQAIASATTVGAEVLGLPQRLGTLAPGALADLLLVDGNPLHDIGCLLGQGERIPLVMKGGVVAFNTLG